MQRIANVLGAITITHNSDYFVTSEDIAQSGNSDNNQLGSPDNKQTEASSNNQSGILVKTGSIIESNACIALEY